MQQAHRFILADAGLDRGEIVPGHQLADRLGGVFGEAHVAVRQDADQLARILDHRDAADLVPLHQHLRQGQVALIIRRCLTIRARRAGLGCRFRTVVGSFLPAHRSFGRAKDLEAEEIVETVLYQFLLVLGIGEIHAQRKFEHLAFTVAHQRRRPTGSDTAGRGYRHAGGAHGMVEVLQGALHVSSRRPAAPCRRNRAAALRPLRYRSRI